jgi:hypothetical protein
MHPFGQWGLTFEDIVEAATDGGCGRGLGNKFTLKPMSSSPQGKDS